MAVAVPLTVGLLGASAQAGATRPEPPAITSDGVLTEVDTSPDLNCYAQYIGDETSAFFGDTACETAVRVGSDTFTPAHIPAGQEGIPYTAVSQTVSGSGTAADPKVITTLVDLGATGMRLTQHDSYVFGEHFYTTRVTLEKVTAGAVAVSVFKAFDCYTADSDDGYGALYVDYTVECIGYNPETQSRNRAERVVPITTPTAWMEGGFAEVWAAVMAGTLPKTCRCDELIDNGLAVQWDGTVAPGQPFVTEHRTEFRGPGQAVTPGRLVDTRDTPGPVAAGSTTPVQVAGQGGVPATGAEVAFLNVTATETVAPGFLTVYPSGQPQPNASNVNTTRVGQTIAGMAMAPLGPDGAVNVFNYSGTEFALDIAAWFPQGSAVQPLANPTRVLDTRPGSQIGYSGPKPGAGSIVPVQIGGNAGVPVDAAAAIMTITPTEADGPGFVTAFPAGQAVPLASNVNVEFAGQSIANLAVVPLGANGVINLYNYGGSHLVADVAGYIVADAGFTSVPPARVLDTRPGSEIGYSGSKPVAGDTVSFQVVGQKGVPGTDVQSVILNVTATEATDAGFVTAYPGGELPTASNLNLERPGQTIANLVIVPVASDGTVSLYTQSGTHLAADVLAWLPN